MGKRMKILYIIMVFACISLVTAADEFGYDNPELPKLLPEADAVITFNNDTGSVNNSDFLDGLDSSYYTPNNMSLSGKLDLTGSGNITQNLFIGGNLTSEGHGQFTWLNFLETTEPPTPPANTLSLYVIEQNGFSRINYKDEYGVTRTINDDEIIVNNSKDSTIAKHRIVYVNGYDAGIPTIDLAKADNISTMPELCVTIESIASHELGRCMVSGLLENVNTNDYDVGLIYVSDVTAGIPTNTPPITPNLTQEIGTILVKDVLVGKIQVVSRSLTGDEFGTINNYIVAGNLTSKGTYNSFEGDVNISGMIYSDQSENIYKLGEIFIVNTTSGHFSIWDTNPRAPLATQVAEIRSSTSGVSALYLASLDRYAINAYSSGGYTTFQGINMYNGPGFAGSMGKVMKVANNANVHDVWQLLKSISDGVGAVGMGASFRYDLENDNNQNVGAVRHYAVWTNASDDIEDADFVVDTMLDGDLKEAVRITSDNVLILNVTILPSCDSTYEGGIGRNTTGIYYCNSTDWRQFSFEN